MQVGNTGEKKELSSSFFPLPSCFKGVCARYLSDAVHFKRFNGNWQSLLPGY